MGKSELSELKDVQCRICREFQPLNNFHAKDRKKVENVFIITRRSNFCKDCDNQKQRKRDQMKAILKRTNKSERECYLDFGSLDKNTFYQQPIEHRNDVLNIGDFPS